MTEMRSRSA